MNFDYLNKMIRYIENNLDNQIDLNDLAKITNTNLFILERIFTFLTNMTIIEYIKKRRLSKAFEEIRNTDQKIIDIAFKYQYNSAVSFSRTFKHIFGITPTECRKGVDSYKIIPIKYFDVDKKEFNFDYKIENIDDTTLYCYHIIDKNINDLLYKIRQLYKEVKKIDRYNEFNKMGMYGIFLKDNGTYHYYLGSAKYFPDLEKYTIKKGKYIVFKLASRKQEDIVPFEKKITREFLDSTSYNINKYMKIEYYEGNNCYIYLSIK